MRVDLLVLWDRESEAMPMQTVSPKGVLSESPADRVSNQRIWLQIILLPCVMKPPAKDPTRAREQTQLFFLGWVGPTPCSKMLKPAVWFPQRWPYSVTYSSIWLRIYVIFPCWLVVVVFFSGGPKRKRRHLAESAPHRQNCPLGARRSRGRCRRLCRSRHEMHVRGQVGKWKPPRVKPLTQRVPWYLERY